MKTTTTLITAVGSAAACAVNERLHALSHRVIGCDIYPRAWNATSVEVDVFFQAVLATDAQSYLAQLEEQVKRYEVDYLIPLTDVEVDVLCMQKERFAALGCVVCAPDEAVAGLCRNKLEMARRLDVLGCCLTIPTFSPYGYEPKESDFPMMLKPLRGRSSQGQRVVRTREAFLSALAMRDDYIAQPYITGDIYTVDVARDVSGQVQTLVRHELLRTVNGLGTTVQILPDHKLSVVCERIAAFAGLVGVVNMEFIEHDGLYYFLEVNPRFSGGVGFSIAAGVDFVALDIACWTGGRIGQRVQAKEMLMTRKMEIVTTQG
ncbi:MAG: ATP-grasp domain-containing protein [Clostridia bacterium]